MTCLSSEIQVLAHKGAVGFLPIKFLFNNRTDMILFLSQLLTQLMFSSMDKIEKVFKLYSLYLRVDRRRLNCAENHMPLLHLMCRG